MTPDPTRPDAARAPRTWRARAAAAALVTATTALGTAGGLAALDRLPKTYRASTTVYVLPTVTALSSGSTATSGTVQIETEAELLASAQVAAPAAKALGGRMAAQDLLDASSVAIPSNSEVLVVTVRASQATLARDAATAMATAYLARRQAQADALVEAETTRLTGILTAQQAALKSNTEDLGRATSDAQKVFLESQRTVVLEQITDVQGRLVELKFAATAGGEIITAAVAPAAASAPTPAGTVGLGALLGLVAGTGLLVARDAWTGRRRRTARTGSRFPVLASVTVDEVPGVLDPAAASALGEVVAALAGPADAGTPAGGPVVLAGLGDAALRARFGTSLAQAWAQALLPAGRPGVPAVTFVLAEAGVELVAPVEAGAPGLADRPGVWDLVAGRATVEAATAALPGGRVRLLAAGARPDAGAVPARLDLLRAWLALERDTAAVLVQTGSVTSPAHAQVALTAGRVVLVAEARLGRSADLADLVEEVERLGLADRVAGVVLVSWSPSAGRTALAQLPAARRPAAEPQPGPQPGPQREPAAGQA